MDWLEFLVEEAGVDGAARTIAYYEAIDWIDGTAAETLQTFLKGFGEGVETDPDPRSSLPVAHHNRSLRFISRIANPDVEMAAFDGRAGGGAAEGGPGRDPMTASERGRPASDRRIARSDRPDGRGVESDGGRRLAGRPDRLPEDSRGRGHSGSGSRSGSPSGQRPADERTDHSESESESGFDWGDQGAE